MVEWMKLARTECDTLSHENLEYRKNALCMALCCVCCRLPVGCGHNGVGGVAGKGQTNNWNRCDHREAYI